MFCKYCGNKLNDDAKYCSFCGKPTNIKINDIQKNYGEINPVFLVSSFFSPILGLILFITDKDKNEKNSKYCGIAGLSGFIFNMILSVIVIITSIYSAIVGEDNNQTNDSMDFFPRYNINFDSNN